MKCDGCKCKGAEFTIYVPVSEDSIEICLCDKCAVKFMSCFPKKFLKFTLEMVKDEFEEAGGDR